MKCANSECNLDAQSLGFCNKHYMRFKRYGDSNFKTSAKSRFDNQYITEPNSGCWLWIGSSDKDGYGYIRSKTDKTNRAHRLSYILFHGNIGKGLFVCHKCDTPSCVNPDHLFLSDCYGNIADMMNKDRSLKGDTHPRAVLTNIQAREIRSLQMLHKDIAEIYKVSPSTISKIKRMETYSCA